MTGHRDHFWQTHSKRYLEMAFSTDKRERPARADGYGMRTGDCGDTVEMFLVLDGERIRGVGYDCHGCLNTNACANSVAHLAEGKTLDDAWQITPQTIVDDLETLPAADTHCAELAVGAFYLALTNCRQNQRQPWKKIYKLGEGSGRF
jgi:nitrogen fixation NifU-like protein